MSNRLNHRATADPVEQLTKALLDTVDGYTIDSAVPSLITALLTVVVSNTRGPEDFDAGVRWLRSNIDRMLDEAASDPALREGGRYN